MGVLAIEMLKIATDVFNNTMSHGSKNRIHKNVGNIRLSSWYGQRHWHSSLGVQVRVSLPSVGLSGRRTYKGIAHNSIRTEWFTSQAPGIIYDMLRGAQIRYKSVLHESATKIAKAEKAAFEADSKLLALLETEAQTPAELSRWGYLQTAESATVRANAIIDLAGNFRAWQEEQLNQPLQVTEAEPTPMIDQVY